MSGNEVWFWVIALGVVVGGIYGVGVVLNAVMGNTTDNGDENMGVGCVGVVLIGIVLGLLYGLVRFVKWAWE